MSPHSHHHSRADGGRRVRRRDGLDHDAGFGLASAALEKVASSPPSRPGRMYRPYITRRRSCIPRIVPRRALIASRLSAPPVAAHSRDPAQSSCQGLHAGRPGRVQRQLHQGIGDGSGPERAAAGFDSARLAQQFCGQDLRTQQQNLAGRRSFNEQQQCTRAQDNRSPASWKTSAERPFLFFEMRLSRIAGRRLSPAANTMSCARRDRRSSR